MISKLCIFLNVVEVPDMQSKVILCSEMISLKILTLECGLENVCCCGDWKSFVGAFANSACLWDLFFKLNLPPCLAAMVYGSWNA